MPQRFGGIVMSQRYMDATPFAEYEDYMRYAPKPEPEAEVKEKGYRCHHCGEEFDHEPAMSFQLPYFPILTCEGDGNYEAQWAYLCSQRCAWLSGIQRHKDLGMGDEEARKHLIEEHALAPPE